MDSRSRLQGIFILFLIITIIQCCSKQTTYTIVPIREEIYREEQSLPLDSLKMKFLMDFIRHDGTKESEFVAILDTAPYRQFLQPFTAPENLTYGKFSVLMQQRPQSNSENQKAVVIDAREKYGPERENRFAYHYQDFWFVFIIDTLHIEGNVIRQEERKFSRLIVMKSLDNEEIRREK